MLTKILLFSLAVSSTLSYASVHRRNEAWKGFSDPEIMASGFTHKLSDLPMEGSVEIGPKAWSGDYWASKLGGINYRWNNPGRGGFDLKSPTREQAQNMSLNDLSKLAPTEKYDLLMGDYNYSMKKDASGTARRSAPDWAGICHGWAPASLFHNEPTPKVLTNPDGIQIPFGSSDIKALLSWYYAFIAEGDSTQMGLRCFFGNWMGGARGCDEDLNAGAFHIVISNMLGLRKEGFIVDIDRFKEVWNQPVVSYKSRIVEDNIKPSNRSAQGTVKEMLVTTEFFYVNESDNNTWWPVIGTQEQQIGRKVFRYRLEINREGKIIGGEWESDARPDFIWSRPKVEKFVGVLSSLPLLLND